MKTREDKRIMVKLESFSKLSVLGHILKKISTFTFGAWSFLLVHIRFTPDEEPKGFVS